MSGRGITIKTWTGLALCLGLLLLAGCGGQRHSARVDDRSAPSRYRGAEYRTVVAGDTLYSIAWEAGADFRELAAWNRIGPPYLIKPGQRLRLRPPSGGRPVSGKTYTVARGDTLYSIARRAGVDHKRLAAWNHIAPPYVIHPGQTLRLGPAKTAKPARRPGSSNARRVPNKSRKAASPSRASPGRIRWTWPTQGKVFAYYTGKGGRKGIDIAGRRGQPIRAAASGRVVYQGNGLKGYGNLVIIKHNADFLSAYAHANRIYVKEGDVIKKGTKIAGMGNSGTDRVKLHFEIRYRGNPVNPLKYLPKR